VYSNYPTAKEVLAALHTVLEGIQNDGLNYDKAELAEIVNRLTCRIAELERKVRESEITSRTED